MRSYRIGSCLTCLAGAGPVLGVLGDAAEGSSLAESSGNNEYELVLGTNNSVNGTTYLQQLFNKVLRESVALGRPTPRVGVNAVTRDAAAFAREVDGASKIHWDGKGLCPYNTVTLAEWDYIMQQPELWHKVIIHIW